MRFLFILTLFLTIFSAFGANITYYIGQNTTESPTGSQADPFPDIMSAIDLYIADNTFNYSIILTQDAVLKDMQVLVTNCLVFLSEQANQKKNLTFSNFSFVLNITDAFLQLENLVLNVSSAFNQSTLIKTYNFTSLYIQDCLFVAANTASQDFLWSYASELIFLNNIIFQLDDWKGGETFYGRYTKNFTVNNFSISFISPNFSLTYPLFVMDTTTFNLNNCSFDLNSISAYGFIQIYYGAFSASNIIFTNILVDYRYSLIQTSSSDNVFTNVIFENIKSNQIETFNNQQNSALVTSFSSSNSFLNLQVRNITTNKLFHLQGYSLVISQCVFESNQFNQFYIEVLTASFSNLTVKNNVHVDFSNYNKKGLFYFAQTSGTSQVVVDASYFSQNVAGTSTPIGVLNLFNTNGTFTIKNSNFSENSAYMGAAILSSSPSINLQNNRFTNNTAVIGGAICFNATNVSTQLKNSTNVFSNNSASLYGNDYASLNESAVGFEVLNSSSAVLYDSLENSSIFSLKVFSGNLYENSIKFKVLDYFNQTIHWDMSAACPYQFDLKITDLLNSTQSNSTFPKLESFTFTNTTLTNIKIDDYDDKISYIYLNGTPLQQQRAENDTVFPNERVFSGYYDIYFPVQTQKCTGQLIITNTSIYCNLTSTNNNGSNSLKVGIASSTLLLLMIILISMALLD